MTAHIPHVPQEVQEAQAQVLDEGQGQASISTSNPLPPVYTADGTTTTTTPSATQLTAPPLYASTSNLEPTPEGSGSGTGTPIAPGAHWSPYDSTANLHANLHANAEYAHQQHTHQHQHPYPHLRQAHTGMGLTSPDAHHPHHPLPHPDHAHSHPHPHTQHPHHPQHPHGQQHPKEKEKPALSIILDTPHITLKGTGPDVEPTTLSGHVVLFLTEATALKELTLQFRGKARIPMPANESLINSATSITYVVCNHDWSFLESSSSSSKRHARTLKAGKHYFPFSLSIGGSLPSSISTPALGGASVAYKLRATALRPGLAPNLHSVLPVPILRSFTPEALEYQQTLEIENTWPDKLMYAIMLPHKAWAAGDALGAVLKFSPLGKGVRVVSVVSALSEVVKVYARSGPLEDGRVVCSARHEIREGGRAVEVDYAAGMLGGGAAHAATVGVGGGSNSNPRGEGSSMGHMAHHHGPQRLGSAFSNLAHIVSSHGSSANSSRRNLHEEVDGERHDGPSHHHTTEQSHVEEDGYENNDIVTYIKLRIPYSSVPTHTPPGGHSPASGSGHATPAVGGSGTGSSTPNTPAFPAASSNLLAGPPNAAGSSSSTPPMIPNVLVTPSHSLEPITVSHRVRWSIYIRNRDGHISELRCSLPVVILDGRLKEEARDASLMSRRMMARSCQIVPERGDEELWGMAAGTGGGVGGGGEDGAEGEGDGQDDRELPSYTAHVRDRVANMFMPEAVTMRVSNPWLGRVSAGSSPMNPSTPAAVGEPADPLASASATEEQQQQQQMSAGSSGRTTRRNSAFGFGLGFDASQHGHGMSQLPHVPASGSSTPLDWVNSELLLSLGGEDVDDALHRFGVDSGAGHSSSAAGGGGGGGGPGGADGTLTPLTPAGVRTPPPPAALQYVSSGPGSRNASRWGSRAGSRASSPERGVGERDHRRQSGDHNEQRISRPGSPTFGVSSASSAHPHTPGPAAMGYMYEPLPSGSGSAGPSSSSHPHHSDHTHSHTHGHGHGHHSNRLGSFFKATMKPFTALSSHKHRHDESKEAHSGTTTHTHNHGHTHSAGSSRDGSPTSGGARGYFDLNLERGREGTGDRDRERRSSVPPAFHASQPDLSLPTGLAMTSGPGSASASTSSRPAQTNAQSPSALSTSRSTSNLPAMRLAAAAANSSSAYGGAFRFQPMTAATQTSSPTTATLPALPSTTHPTLPATTTTTTTSTTSTLPSSSTPSSTTPHPPRDPLHRALTEVPDYAIASRGFLGGVPPLSSMRGLPSYEEAVGGGGGGGGGARGRVAGAGVSSQNQEGDQAGGGANAGASAGAGTTGPSLSRSEPDIAGRFARVRILEPMSPRAQVQAQAQASASASTRASGAGPSRRPDDEEEGEEEGDGDDEGVEDDGEGEEDEGIQMRSPRSRAIQH